MSRSSLKEKVSQLVRRSRRNVFLRSDFEKVSQDYDQVGRALRELVKENQLIKLGYGLYSKAAINRYNGESSIAAMGGFNQVAHEAIKRLNVKFTTVTIDRNLGFSIHVPMNAVICTKQRFSRKIEIKDKFRLRVIKK